MKFLSTLVFLAAAAVGVAAPAPLLRNDFTTNADPQVNRGFGITIQTNAGHKLVINVDGGALTNQIYWTNIAGLLRTIGEGRYTNLWIDTNIAAMTIGSIASIDPTNGNAFYGAGAGSNNVLTITASVGVGSDALGNNSGAVADSLAFGEAAFRDNSGTISISTAIGQGAGGANSSSIENSTLIGSSAMANNTALKRGVVVIGHQGLSTWASAAITNLAMVGTVIGNPTTGVNLGSFGFNNTFANVGAASNRWIFGWNATNFAANQMVFGSPAITSHVFRAVGYTFPSIQGVQYSLLQQDDVGVLGWNRAIKNLIATNTAATSVPFTISGSGGTTNDLFLIGSGNTNYWRVTSSGLIGSVQDGVGVIGASVSSSANRFLSVNALRMRAGDSRVQAYGFVTEAGFGTLSSMDAAGFGTVKNRTFTIYNSTIDQSGAGTWAMFHWTNSGTFTFLTNIIAAGSIVATNPIATNVLGGFNDIRTNVAPYTWTNFAVASANGITTNDSRRSLLRGQMKFTLGAIADVAEIIFTVTNGASVYSLTNGMDTAVGAAGSRIAFLAFIGPTNTFAFTTNVSGTGTAVINNMTMEPQ